MASYELDTPQASVFTVQDNDPRLRNSSFPPISHVNPHNRDIHGFLPLPTPLLTSSRKSQDISDSPASHTSDASSSHPPVHLTFCPTLAGSRDTNPESALGILAPPTRGASSIVLVTPPSPTKTHVRSDTSRPSPLVDSNARCVSSGDTDMASDITRNDSIQNGDHAAVRLGSAESDSNVNPFAFKLVQLVTLVDSKSLENLEILGGVEGLLYGLGTDRLRGLSTKVTGRSHCGPSDPVIINAITSSAAEKTPSISPTGVLVSEGLQRAESLCGYGVHRPASLKIPAPYEATIEDRQRIYGQNILPRRPGNGVLLLMWLALHDKVIVSAKTSHPFPWS